jgi:hypothetical protein
VESLPHQTWYHPNIEGLSLQCHKFGIYKFF